MDATAKFVYHEPRILFAMILILLAACAQRAMPLISCVHMYAAIAIYSLHRTTPINPLLLQEFYPCSMPGDIILQ